MPSLDLVAPCAGALVVPDHLDRPMRLDVFVRSVELAGRSVTAVRYGRFLIDVSPSETVGPYAADNTRRGRDSACTCGSWRKWKRRHDIAS